MPRTKRHTNIDSAYLIQLNERLEEKIRSEWSKKWQLEFGDEYKPYCEISKKRQFTIELRKDIKKSLPKNISLLSIDTLKRVLNYNKESDFQENNKNNIAIYLGYDDWLDFKKKCQITNRSGNQLPALLNHRSDNQSIAKIKSAQIQRYDDILSAVFVYEQKRSAHLKVALVSITVILLVAIISAIYYFKFSDWWFNDVDFELVKVQKNKDNHYPVTIFVKWDLKLHGLNKPVRIAYHDDYKNMQWWPVFKKKGQTSFYIYQPGLRFFQLQYGDKVIKEIKTPIYENAWVGWVSETIEAGNYNRLPLKTGEMLIRNNTLQLTHKMKLTRSNYFWTKFRFFSKFDVNADSLNFECVVRNAENHGGVNCFDTGIKLYTYRGPSKGYNSIDLKFVCEGCVHYSSINFSNYIACGKSDTSIWKMAQSFNQWRKINISTHNMYGYICIDQDTLYTIPYKKLFGQLIGTEFLFKGSGELDYVMLNNNHGDTLFYDDFGRKVSLDSLFF